MALKKINDLTPASTVVDNMQEETDIGGSIANKVTKLQTKDYVNAGKAGGKTIEGGTAASENLVLDSTNDATKGEVQVGDGSTLHANTANYETLLTNDNDIPNKKYVDVTAGGQAKQETFIPTLGQTVFTLAQAPSGPNAFGLFLNGQLRENPTDYTFIGTTLTWNDPGGLTLKTTDELIAWYDFTAPSSTIPAFVARTTGTKVFETGDGTPYVCRFDTVDVDVENNYYHITATFTAPRNGIYHFDTVLNIGGIASGHTALDVQLLSSLQGPFLVWMNPVPILHGASDRIMVNGSLSLKMQTAETLQVILTVTGGAKVIELLEDSYFSGNLVTRI